MNKYACIALLLFLSCESKKHDNDRIALIDQYLKGQQQHFQFNGNVLLAENGEVIYQKSFGMANYYEQRPLNDSSVFELASVSKQFTATGILLLMEQGKLKLTDTLQKFFPDLPYKHITLKHMLTHTSGLPAYEDLVDEKWDHNKIAFNGDVIKMLAKEKPPVLFQPGEKWEYSNTAFMLLASIIEKVSGQSFKEFMASQVYQPLGMRHTRIYNTRRSGEVIDNYAYGFVWSDSLSTFVLPDSMEQLRFVYYMDGIQGDGITNSTASDLLKWDRAVKNHTLLTKTTTDEMLSPQALSDTTINEYYGYGVFVGENENGKYISHSGGWPGYSTNLSRYVDKDRTIILLSNNNSNAPAIEQALARILSGMPVQMPYQHHEVQVDSISLSAFAGKYRSGGSIINLEFKRDTLYRRFSSGYKQILLPESTTKVFVKGSTDRQIEIEREPDGKASYFLIDHGIKKELSRIQ